MSTTTVTREAADALAATSTEVLLTKAYALTHQIDRARAEVDKHRPLVRTARGQVAHAWAKQQVRDLRAARDLITAEVIRRTEGQS